MRAHRSGKLLMACVILLAVGAVAGDLRGVVTDAEGKPIAGESVWRGGLIEVKTDGEGRYVVPGGARVISVRVPGYRPRTVVVGDATEINFRLEREVERDAACSPQRFMNFIAGLMRFRIGREVDEKGTYADVDYSGRVLEFQASDKKYYARTMSGPMCCSGRPVDQTYINSASFSERLWRSGEIVGLDARGISRDGTRWRWMGPLVGEMFEYAGASEEAARVFDAVMDSMCVAARR